MSKTLILASASPRRRDLLSSIGLSFRVLVADIDERRWGTESAEAYVLRLSRSKAEAVLALLPVSERGQAVVLAADTAVVLDGEILGKPQSLEEAREMLGRLSGRSHRVLTGVTLLPGECGTEPESFVVETRVHFVALSAAQLEAYLASGESMDKAGAYGIQGRAAAFVYAIEGSYTNVVGLPLAETSSKLQAMGLVF